MSSKLALLGCKCHNMSSNVVSFRHSSRHAILPSRRHDQRHVADMLPTQHTMSANEGLGRHDRLRHSLLSQTISPWVPSSMYGTVNTFLEQVQFV